MALALHRIRFVIGTSAEIEIEWTKGRAGAQAAVSIPGISLAEIEMAPDSGSNSAPAICWRADSPVLYAPLQLREDTEYYIDITLPVTPQEAAHRVASIPGWPFNHRLSALFRPDPPRRWRSDKDGRTTVSGNLRLRSHAGLLDLSPDASSSFFVEVVCRKLSYLEEFKTLLDEVAAEATELLLQIDSPVSASFKLADLAPETKAALLFQLRHILADSNLPSSITEIRRSFHSRLQASRSVRPIAETQEFDTASFVEEMDPNSLLPGGPLSGLFRGYTPYLAPTSDITDTVDTPENRYVRSFLQDLRQLAQLLYDSLSDKLRSRVEIASWIDAIDEELSSDVWKSVGPLRVFPSNSQVLMKRQGYRDILRFDLSLRMSLSLPWKRSLDFADGLLGDLRPINELYEYWCLFHLRHCLIAVCAEQLPVGKSVIDSSAGGFEIRLRRGNRSKLEFIYRRGPDRTLFVNLYYNRRFKRPSRASSFWYGSYTARFDPDFSLEARLEHNGSVARHWLHFDAKYRVDFGNFKELLTEARRETDATGSTTDDYEDELRRLHRRDDLFKMHTYRDGILSSRGAYILFPGTLDHVESFVRHPSALGGDAAYLFPGVGAFSLCPGRAQSQRPKLRDFIAGVLAAIYEGKPYQEETGFFGC